MAPGMRSQQTEAGSISSSVSPIRILLLVRLNGCHRSMSSSSRAYLKALGAAVSTGPLGGLRDAATVAEAAQATLPASPSLRPVDQLLDGLIVRFMGGYKESVSKLRHALQACGDADAAADTEQWQWLVVRTAMDLWEDEVLEPAAAVSSGRAELLRRQPGRDAPALRTTRI